MSIVRVPFNLTGGGAAAYVPANAIWLDGSADYLSRTPSVNGNRKTFSISCWIKRARLGTDQYVFSAFTTSGNAVPLYFQGSTDEKARSSFDQSLSPTGDQQTNAEFRDPTAWFHYLKVVDTTVPNQWIYINGVEATYAVDNNPSLNDENDWNEGGTPHTIGCSASGITSFFNGYLAEVIHLDGYAASPTDFGEVDANGNWVPKDPTGLTFGTNGFWLDFADSTNLGLDVAGGGTITDYRTQLLLHCEGSDTSTTFTDSGRNGLTVTANGDAQIDTGQFKFGSASAQFDGTGDYLSVPHQDGFNFSTTGAFTIDFWAYVTSGDAIFYVKRSAEVADNIRIGRASGYLEVLVDSGGGTWDVMLEQTITLFGTGAWHHVALTWDGSNYRVFFDGSLVHTTTNSNGPNNNTASISLGAGQSGGTSLNGWMDEIRIRNDAVWTSGFTPPTSAYSNPIQGNDFTPTSMSSENQVTDTPSDDAENDVGNYWTLNPLAEAAGVGSLTPGSLVDLGNTRTNFTSSNPQSAYGTIAVPLSGTNVFQIEGRITVAGSVPRSTYIGFTDPNRGVAGNAGIHFRADTGAGTGSQKVLDGVEDGGNYTSWKTVDTDVGMTYDPVNDEVKGYVDGVLQWTQTSASTYLTGSHALVWVFMGDNGKFVIKNGATGFRHPITGAVPLSTANLPAPTVTDPSAYFKTILYTGDGTNDRAITGCADAGGTNWTPDLVWFKKRSDVSNWSLYDQVRGVGQSDTLIYTNTTDAAQSDTTFNSFDSGGFTIDSGGNALNDNTATYVTYCLKAGGTASTNTDGDVNSSVSVATHGGFSVGTFTTSSSPATGFTIGHGLSRTPNFLVTYLLGGGSAWQVWHDDLGGADKWIRLNLNIAVETDTTAWNNTAPTSTVWSTNTSWVGTNASAWFMAFAKTPGLIGIGKYTGNGSSDGPYVVVDDGASGFRPVWLLYRDIDNVASWGIVDAVRDTYNPVSKYLFAQSPAQEGSTTLFDFTANGFKCRETSAANTSGATYIYLAFAEYPFGGDGVAQAKAR